MKQEAKETAELEGSGRNPGERRQWLSPGRPGWRWEEVGGVRVAHGAHLASVPGGCLAGSVGRTLLGP